LVQYGYGRRRAPNNEPDGAEDALLVAVVKMAKKLAPGAVKVTVGSKTRSLA
jgi:hypothetical protein